MQVCFKAYGPGVRGPVVSHNGFWLDEMKSVVRYQVPYYLLSTIIESTLVCTFRELICCVFVLGGLHEVGGWKSPKGHEASSRAALGCSGVFALLGCLVAVVVVRGWAPGDLIGCFKGLGARQSNHSIPPGVVFRHRSHGAYSHASASPHPSTLLAVTVAGVT